MTSDMLALLLACAAGAALGFVFFGGLWWTVQRAVSSERPALWFVGSLLVRMSIVLIGFHLVSDGQWQRLLPCVLGFFIARLAVLWLTRPEPLLSAPPGGHHAP